MRVIRNVRALTNHKELILSQRSKLGAVQSVVCKTQTCDIGAEAMGYVYLCMHRRIIN